MSERIGIDLLWLRPGAVGGTEDYVVSLLRSYAERADGPELVLFSLDRLVAAHPDIADSYEVVSLAWSGTPRWLRVAAQATWLRAQVRSRRIAAFHHAGGTLPPFARRPSALTVHDLQPLAHPDRFTLTKRAWLAAALPRSARTAHVVMTLSEHARAGVIERLGVDPDRVVVVPHGVVRPDVATLPDRASLAERYGVEIPWFLYPAITYVHKNHRVLLDAFARVVADEPATTLVLTGGEADHEGRVRAEIERLGLAGNVLRLGRVDRPVLDALYRDATALTYPSLYEGFGLPVVEAMAAGCPVLASDAAALPEVVGGAGRLLPVDDASAWASAMLDLLRDDRARRSLIDAGLERAAEFSWTRAASAAADAYRRLLAGAP